MWVILSLLSPPGPRGSCGHAVVPPLWLRGWPHLPLWLPGRLQRSLPPSAEVRSILRDLQARCPHLHLQHHDAGDGDGWSHWWKRISGFFQCREATYGRWGQVILQIFYWGSRTQFCYSPANTGQPHAFIVSPGFCLTLTYCSTLSFLTPSSFSYFHREPVLWRTTDQITGLRKDAQLAQLQLPSRHQLLVAHLRRAEQCKLITLHFIQIESGSHQNFCYYY